jgi:RNA polymerase sigma-70 factor (ECF subfamily)
MLEDEFESILEAARAGGEWAWSRLYRDLSGQVLGYLRRQGAREVDDLMGEVWLQVARNIEGFRGGESGFRSWVFTVAHHRVIDERRRLARRPEDPTDRVEEWESTVDGTSEAALDAIATDRVQRLIDGLAPAQRDVLLLRIVGGLTIAEIAEVLGRREGGVKALQRRGLEALRRMMQREGVSL